MKRKELELIYQYLERTLPEQATSTFEQLLRDDRNFRAGFNQIKLIINDISSLAIAEELSAIKQINKFLEQGGTLLRHNLDGKGENVIEDLTFDRDWRVVLICETMDNCVKIISRLIKKYPDRFQAMEKK